MGARSRSRWSRAPVPTRAPVACCPRSKPAVFADEGVDVEEFRQYLRDNELALIVSRDVTQRDRADVQQPFNLRGARRRPVDRQAGHDLRRVLPADLPGRRAARLRRRSRRRTPAAACWRGRCTSPASRRTPARRPAASRSAADGSMAALVPGRRALTWQLTDRDGSRRRARAQLAELPVRRDPRLRQLPRHQHRRARPARRRRPTSRRRCTRCCRTGRPALHPAPTPVTLADARSDAGRGRPVRRSARRQGAHARQAASRDCCSSTARR